MKRKHLWILSFLNVLILTGCEKLQYEHFQDVIFTDIETKDYGLATGEHAFYITWGEMRLKGSNIIAGEAVSIDHRFRFPICELLRKYPNFKNEHSLKAAASQIEMWKQNPPDVTVRNPNR